MKLNAQGGCSMSILFNNALRTCMCRSMFHNNYLFITCMHNARSRMPEGQLFAPARVLSSGGGGEPPPQMLSFPQNIL